MKLMCKRVNYIMLWCLISNISLNYWKMFRQMNYGVIYMFIKMCCIFSISENKTTLLIIYWIFRIWKVLVIATVQISIPRQYRLVHWFKLTLIIPTRFLTLFWIVKRRITKFLVSLFSYTIKIIKICWILLLKLYTFFHFCQR